MADRQIKSHFLLHADVSGDWNSIDDMPFGQTVIVKSMTGLVRTARRSGEFVREADRWGPRRLHCWSSYGGDLQAVAWQPLHDIDKSP